MKDLVSVIIPSYNHERYIKDSIMSVLKQTYKNLEVFIMDDCSTDNSQTIIKKLKDPRLKIFCSKKNKGTVRTINELTNKCHGKYIGIIGSDDIWKEDKIEKQVEYLENHLDIGASFTSAEIIDEDGNLYVDDDAFNQNIFKIENMKRSERMRLFFEKGNHLCHSSSLIRKEVIDEIGLYDITYRQFHDFDYWVRLLNKYNIYIHNDKLVKYRRFKNSKQNLSNNSFESMIRVVNENNAIINWMFNNINDNLFKEGFNDLFVNKKSNTSEELICEKYFILLNYRIVGANNKQLAFNLVFNYPDKDILFDLLEKKYNYSLNDFYNDTGEAFDVFNYDFLINSISDVGVRIRQDKKIIEEKSSIIDISNDKINVLETNLCMLKKSLSWRITKPLRKIKGMIKNEKNKNI